MWPTLFLHQCAPVNSLDPNDKIGPTGVGVSRFTSGAQSMNYSIYFDNRPTATAPAQSVAISDTLNAGLDLSTLTLGPITFPNQVVTPPSTPVSIAAFTTTVDIRPTTNLLIKINASLNTSTRVLTWIFQSLDPATGLPPIDPLSGFLPPGAEGSVFFTVMPKSTVPTGTTIQNMATVVFDLNPPINTPTWSNTIDNASPTSRVIALPTTEMSASFIVSWSGSDVDSGIKDFSVYVSDNGGAFALWLTNVAATSATFNGQAGHAYGFYSVARDLVGNVEPGKTVAEATTTVAVGSPQLVVTRSLSRDKSTNDIVVAATITNDGSATASNVQLTVAKISSTVTETALPQSLGVVVAGASTRFGAFPWLRRITRGGYFGDA